MDSQKTDKTQEASKKPKPTLTIPNYQIKITPVTPRNAQKQRTLPRYTSTSFVNPQANVPDEIYWNQKASKKNHDSSHKKIDISQVFKVSKNFAKDQVINETSITKIEQLSQDYEAQIFIKRQEQQRGRTFKIRGAYNHYLNRSEKDRQKGVTFASDGNFALSLSIISGRFKYPAIIFVPQTCSRYRIEAIKANGLNSVQVIVEGKQYQQAVKASKAFAQQKNICYVELFQDQILMNGYATIANQIQDEAKKIEYDYMLVPSGGGALVASIASFMKQINPTLKVIAVQPDNCRPFYSSIIKGSIVQCQKSSSFCNGSSIKSIGNLAFQIGKTSIDGFVSVPQTVIASKMLKLYSQGIISQPSGALGIAGLQKIKNLIKGKKVLCLLSGANMDLPRFDEARQISARFKGHKNFYIVNVPNKKNAIYDLIVGCFKTTDIITIKYSKNFNKNQTQALLAVESLTQQDVESFILRLNEFGLNYENVTQRDDLIQLFF